MKTLIINNKTFLSIDSPFIDGICVPCANKDEFLNLWANFTNESIKEFMFDGETMHGSHMLDITASYNEDGSFLARVNIALKTDEDILQETVEQLAQTAAEAEAIVEWKKDTAYKFGDIVSYRGSVYRVLQSHTSQSDWLPNAVPALYSLLYKGEEPQDEIPEWRQPDSTNPYMKGDKVLFEGNIYESLIDNNVWSPSAYPDGWQLIEE